MKLLMLALAAGIAATTPKVAAAAETQSLQLKPKAALVALVPHNSAPFVNPPAAEPDLDLVPRRDPRQDQSNSSCSSQRALCYDPRSGRILYKPAREFMPELPGLTPEKISVKKDRLILRYSF